MTDSAFWRFSLNFYALPGVAATCIDLQDRHGADVNVLLFALFLAERERALSSDDIVRIDAGVRSWREGVVGPLRAARRNLREPVGPFDRELAAALRTGVKRIELEAERIQQEALERTHAAEATGTAAASRAEAARVNLAAYCAYLGGLPDEFLSPLLDAFDAASVALRSELTAPGS